MPGRSGWARADDGAHLAFEVLGDGPPLLHLAEGFIPVSSYDDQPRLARAFRRLAASFTVLRFDRRGVGASDPVSPQAPPTLERCVADAVAVLDAAGFADAAVLAAADAGLVGLVLAAEHPDRVQRLALVNAFARFAWAPDHPVGLRPEVFEDVRARATLPGHPDGAFDLLSVLAPSEADDPQLRRWWEAAGRQGASPATAAALRAVVEGADVRHVLPRVDVPALVCQRTDQPLRDPGQGRLLAERLPQATLVELPGQDDLWWCGDTDAVLTAVEEFLLGAPSGVDADRERLALVMADVVDSTGHAARLGDRPWRVLLEHVLQRAAVLTEQHDGTWRGDTGDGVFATFSSTDRAAAFALALRSAASAAGLPVRTGVHVGDVELRAGGVAGLQVHLTARVMAEAGPEQVLVTQAVVDGGLHRADLRPVGRRQLRGIPAPVVLHELGPLSPR